MEATKTPAIMGKLIADAAPIKWLIAACVVIADYILPTDGSKDAAIGAAALIALDTVTGLMAAWQAGTVSSKKFSRVLVKFLGYGSVLVIAAIISKNVAGMSEYSQLGATAILTLIILTESISILENLTKLGIALPFGLTDMLKKRLGQEEKQ